jgi:hypothetical protein
MKEEVIENISNTRKIKEEKINNIRKEFPSELEEITE